MPRITISVIAPNPDQDGDLITLDLAPGLTLADLKGFVQAETNIAPETQQFFLNNAPLVGDSKTLEQAGISDGDMLAMISRPTNSDPAAQTSQASGSSSRQRRPQADTDQIETTRLQILGDPRAIAQVRESKPALAEAINDPELFREVYLQMVREQQERDRERALQEQLLNEDPYNVEAQARIEEIIRQQGVQENLQLAYEHNPEVFARVNMLYIQVEVNGHPVKAFVDSGAQTTIMSPSCAESCGIKRLIDTRYSGIAKGVGTAQILGRVHSAAIRIGKSTMMCSFTVMEGKDVDLLLGLDMLKRFQAVIDLRRNKLAFGDDNEVDFLGEADIPKIMEEAMQNEPTISGPNNTEIGTQSGTVKPAGTSAEASASTSAGKKAAFSGAGRTLGSSATPAGTPATPAQQTQQTQQNARRTHPEEKINQLVGLGFERAAAIAALDACDGNVEYAAGLLFN